MDETSDPLLFLDDGQSFEDYIKNFTSFPDCAEQEATETACELAEYDSVFNSKGEVVLVRSGTRNAASGDFEAQGGDVGGSAILRTTYWDPQGEKAGTQTEIRSGFIKAALKEVVPMYKDRNIKFSHIVFTGKPKHLFHYRDALYSYARDLEEGSLAQQHVSLLFMHLHQELSDAVSAYTTHVEFAPKGPAAPSIDFPNLWTIFKEGELVYLSSTASEDGADMLIRFKSATCNCDCNSVLHRFVHSWEIIGDYIDSNGKSLGRRETSTKVAYFDGVLNLDQLPVLPLRFHPRKDAIKEQLAARGRKYLDLQKRKNHGHYKGMARIMLEGTLFRIGSRTSQLTWVHGRIMTDEETFFKDSPFSMSTLIPFTSPLTDEEYMICRSHVRGFSFKEDKWGYFNVDLIEPIEFDTAISKSTAECCGRPLLRIDGSTLQNSHEGFEATLSRILRLAHSWKAIALLDEADIFLEKRSQLFRARHCLATAFLRVLEYHQGVLFLTTNRVNSFDRAFKSRIQVAIHYPPLNQQSRQALWQIFLSKSSLPATRKEDWYQVSAEMALEELNGRQIRDVVRIAHASAFGEDSRITVRHLRDALDAMRTFEVEFDKGRDAEVDSPAPRKRKRLRREVDDSGSESSDTWGLQFE
ncbi:hypothetical protein N0V84_006717 [Fusarium piperis]|uniref:ATPase AAA-type core domain-containing protein n=1 Tax=Fusarium piperis TaxID=1435070 RepID=A0A9W8WBD4_9HYPO|nr:hypothetical protein N0V84_006717 [Fusarium piperis]